MSTISFDSYFHLPLVLGFLISKGHNFMEMSHLEIFVLRTLFWWSVWLWLSVSFPICYWRKLHCWWLYKVLTYPVGFSCTQNCWVISSLVLFIQRLLLIEWALLHIRHWFATPTNLTPYANLIPYALVYLAGSTYGRSKFLGWSGVYVSLLVACCVNFWTKDTRT